MESRFGYEFTNIKVHTDEKAARSSESINALAYTIGNDIVFREGQFQPNTPAGKRLIAHELTHVLQQNNDTKGTSRVQNYSGQMTISRDVDKSGTKSVTKSVDEQFNDLVATSKFDDAINLIITSYRFPTANLKSIRFDASVTTNATTSGAIPGKSVVKIGPKSFSRGFPSFVHTLRHELEHVEQRASGMTSKSLREFLAESLEILSVGLPEEDMAGLKSDASEALEYWNQLSTAEQRANWSQFISVRKKLSERYNSASTGDKKRFKSILDKYNAVGAPPPASP
jgi:hypothetical protein